LEHPAVLETCRTLAAAGRNVAYADVLSNGEVSLPSLGERLAEMNDCSLVTLMYANHETGVIQPVGQAAAMARMHGALLLCDAVQALSTQKVDVHALGVDFLSISGHKLGAPRGIGALYVRRGLKLSPLHTGGGQESGRRSGTESVALAVGLARALELCAERRVENERIRNNSQRLLALLSDIPGTTVNGWNDPDKQLPGIVNVSFDCVDGGALVLWLDRMGICVSAGSACSSAGKHPSAVLLAMGREERMAMSSLRISLGPKNTAEQVEKIAAEICRGVEILRSLDLVGSSKYTRIGTK
jgi:cysteine desulfurase